MAKNALDLAPQAAMLYPCIHEDVLPGSSLSATRILTPQINPHILQTLQSMRSMVQANQEDLLPQSSGTPFPTAAPHVRYDLAHGAGNRLYREEADNDPTKDWWASSGKAKPEDIGLADVVANLVNLTYRGLYDVVKVEWCLCKTKAVGTSDPYANEIREFWEEMYRHIAAKETKYKIPGDQCTSTAWRSVNGNPRIGDLGLGAMTPETWLGQLGDATHKCGANKGKFLYFERIQPEKDPYSL